MRTGKMLVAAVLLSLAIATTAIAQTADHGNVEFAMLGGATIVIPEDGDNATVISLPHGSAGAWLFAFPSFRMSFWTQSPLIVDFGFSVFTVSEDGDDATLLNLEGGVGTAFKTTNSNVRPFVGGVVGMLSVSNGDTESELYLGGQGGVRIFINDYSAARFQVGYRHMMGDEFEFGALEIAGGISFFL